jgi:hypothetical protein
MPRPEQMPPTEKAEAMKKINAEFNEHFNRKSEVINFLLEKIVVLEWRIKNLEG